MELNFQVSAAMWASFVKHFFVDVYIFTSGHIQMLMLAATPMIR